MKHACSIPTALLATIVASSFGSSASESSLAACDSQHEEAFGLLQRQATASHSAHQQGNSIKAPIPMVTIKSFTDSECSSWMGTELNISLEEEPQCILGWTYACSCQGDSKVVIGNEYESPFCNSTGVQEHILPLDTCLPGETTDSSGFQTVSEVSGHACPCCGAGCQSSSPVSLPIVQKPPPAENDGYDGPPSYDLAPGPIIHIDFFWGPDACESPPVDTYCALADGVTRQFGVIHTCQCSENKGKVLEVKFRRRGPFGKRLKLVDNECTVLIPGLVWVKVNATQCPDAGQATCTVHGDPHITVFDDAEVSLLGVDSFIKQANAEQAKDADDMFGWGDFWLVKSQEVHIQGRYRKVYYPMAKEPLNHTYLTSVAVGGPFMRGYTLIVEPRSGSVTWALAGGSHTLLAEAEEDFVFEEGELIKAKYSARTAIVPEHADHMVRGLDVELPSNVKLLIDRFGKHLDLRIKMAADAGGADGVDGQCGNLNGDASDDTAEMLEQRIGYQVPKEELLFI